MPYYKRVFAKPCEYNGTVFRSHLERDFAMWLDENNIQWEYEKHQYELLPKTNYFDATDGKMHTQRSITILPDFYLPQANLIVEIKGLPYDDRAFRLKMRLFKEKYPDKPICILKDREEFNSIPGIISNLNANKKEKVENNMTQWKEYDIAKSKGVTKQYLDNYYMLDPQTRIIVIFRNNFGKDSVIYRTPVTLSCYLKSQEVWGNLCEASRRRNMEEQSHIRETAPTSRDEFLRQGCIFTDEELYEIGKNELEALEYDYNKNYNPYDEIQYEK